MLCLYRHALGKAGQGFHAARVPWTTTALNDYVGTLLLAWLLAAASGRNLVEVTIFLVVSALLLHRVFFVQLSPR